MFTSHDTLLWTDFKKCLQSNNVHLSLRVLCFYVRYRNDHFQDVGDEGSVL